jgi:hypothetical protein
MECWHKKHIYVIVIPVSNLRREEASSLFLLKATNIGEKLEKMVI